MSGSCDNNGNLSYSQKKGQKRTQPYAAVGSIKSFARVRQREAVIALAAKPGHLLLPVARGAAPRRPGNFKERRALKERCGSGEI